MTAKKPDLEWIEKLYKSINTLQDSIDELLPSLNSDDANEKELLQIVQFMEGPLKDLSRAAAVTLLDLRQQDRIEELLRLMLEVQLITAMDACGDKDTLAAKAHRESLYKIMAQKDAMKDDDEGGVK